ncbi:MAG: antitoxin MazE-like protein [Acetobacteraceae bacterium]
MAATAERMKALRDRRRAKGLREVRILTPDPRSAAVRRRVAAQVAALDQDDEAAALRWIEQVAEFDAPDPQQ